MNPRILILLAAHNGALHIEDQIRSILLQSNVEVHVIVRDDASSDSTVATVSELAAAENRITLISATTPSGAAAQNFFFLIREVEAFDFDFIALSDQDDIWHSYKLEQATRALRDSDCAGYSSAVTAVWPNGKTKVLRQCDSMTASDFLFEGAGQGCTFVLTSRFYYRARQFLREHQTLTRNIHYHDWALYALARSWKLAWAFDPSPTMKYLQHASNDTGARSSLKGVRRRLTLISNGWYRTQLREIAKLCSVADAQRSPRIAQWWQLIQGRTGFGQRLSRVLFCITGGRRKPSDNAALIISALLGWV